LCVHYVKCGHKPGYEFSSPAETRKFTYTQFVKRSLSEKESPHGYLRKAMTHRLKVVLSPLVWVSLLSAETATGRPKRLLTQQQGSKLLFAEFSGTHISKEMHFAGDTFSSLLIFSSLLSFISNRIPMLSLLSAYGDEFECSISSKFKFSRLCKYTKVLTLCKYTEVLECKVLLKNKVNLLASYF